MRLNFRCLVYLFCLFLMSCFSQKETPVATVKTVKVVKKTEEAPKDEILQNIIRYFEYADGIHREAWWVLSDDKRPVGKSPFGKVQRALLSSQNIKLTNKSLFRCDRYLVKRDILSTTGYPQKMEVFEKCSEKADAKKLATVDVPKKDEVQVMFSPDNLEEVIGVSASILNKASTCTLVGTNGQLESLTCKDWAQEKDKTHMIRLDVYEYKKTGKNLIKLRGKVYENLVDIRKVEADVPLDGKIVVTETELYAPEVAPAAPPSLPQPKSPAKTVAPVEGQEPVADPDVLMQRKRGQKILQGFDEGVDPNDPKNHGIPEGEEIPMAPGAPVEGIAPEGGGVQGVDALEGAVGEEAQGVETIQNEEVPVEGFQEGVVSPQPVPLQGVPRGR